MRTSQIADPRTSLQPEQNAVNQARAIPAVDSIGLFQGQREIRIEHDGVQYRLRITRRNKLILQK